MSRELTLLTVNGHPDDETVTAGGTMARYAVEGVRVVCVVATLGEAGEIVRGPLATRENLANLGSIRQDELDRALRRLGVGELFLLGYRDSGMPGTQANDDARSFWKADTDQAAGRLVNIIRITHADVIVAPNSFGGDGHPDHIRAGEIARIAYERAGDPTAYPEQLRGGLEPWAPSKIYEVVDQLTRRDKLRRLISTGGVRDIPSTLVRVARHWSPAVERERAKAAAAQGAVTTRIDVRPFIEARLLALAEHRTQIAPNSHHFALTADQRKRACPTENFTLWASRVATSIPERDLFAGLR